MNGGSHYTDWVVKSNISYGDYLQGKEFERSIRYGIHDQTKQLIASNEQLARECYETLEYISDGINSGFTTMSADIAKIQESFDSGFQQIAMTFEWGFSEMLVSLGRVNDSLDALIKIAKTPAQTWAYEQFEIARDEFRRGLYHESFESVLKAINGYGSNPGYKTEFRFHFLQGTIRLGSYKNFDLQLVNPSDAEAAFLKAARYARNDFPVEAARFLLCAGRAAFVQQKAEDSLNYSKNAISLNPELAEAYYQINQAYCVLGRPENALKYLVTAIVSEHAYAIKAASNADICQYPEMLKKALRKAKDKLKATYEKEKNTFEIILNKIKETVLGGYSVNIICSKQITDVCNYEKDFKAEASKKNIFGYVHAAKLAQEGKHVIQLVATSFKRISSNLIDEEQRKLERAIAAIDSEINEIRSTIKDIDSEISNPNHKDPDGIDFALSCLLSIVLFLLIIPADYVGYAFWGFVVLNLFTAGLPLWLGLYVIAKAICFVRKSIFKTEERKAQSRKQQLRQTLQGKAEPQKQQLQQKISKLKAVKSRITSFNMQKD